MEVEYTRIDLEKCRQAGEDPILIIPRDVGATWYVPDGTLDPKAKIKWTYFQQQSSVLIPLVPYILQTAPELAMAYVLSLGLHCAVSLPRPIAKIHLAIGTPVEVLPAGGLRYYVGFGLLLER
jgi:hypothetical protein